MGEPISENLILVTQKDNEQTAWFCIYTSVFPMLARSQWQVVLMFILHWDKRAKQKISISVSVTLLPLQRHTICISLSYIATVADKSVLLVTLLRYQMRSSLTAVTKNYKYPTDEFFYPAADIFGVSEVSRKNKKGGCYHPR